MVFRHKRIPSQEFHKLKGKNFTLKFGCQFLNFFKLNDTA